MAIFPGSAIPSAVSDYEIDNSLRFEDGDSPKLTRTPSSEGSRRIWTGSFWYKMGNIGVRQVFFSTPQDGSGGDQIELQSDGTLYMRVKRSSDDANYALTTSAVYRDPGAWMHICWSVNSDAVTESDRLKLYVNGVEPTLASSNYPPINTDFDTNTAVVHQISSRSGESTMFIDGYIAEYYFIDGTQYAASDFGELDSTTNQWKPLDSDDVKDTVTFGTNGFYQKYNSTELAASFTDSAWGLARQSFTSSTTWTVPAGITSVSYLVVGGGGGGGGSKTGVGSGGSGGGGGSGGYRTGTLSVTPAASLTVTIGPGGAGGARDVQGVDGSDSVFDSITSKGGGGGGKRYEVGSNAPSGGGSGGGAGSSGNGTTSGGTGSTYGNNGGTNGGHGKSSGGGGGSAAVGSDAPSNSAGGAGGAGTSNDISGSSVTYGIGGTGGFQDNHAAGAAGAANTGNGGGGAAGSGVPGGTGGSGIVVISYTSTTTARHTITANGDVTNQRPQPHGVTANGNAHLVGPKQGTSVIPYDGTGDYLSIPDSSDWDFGTDNFTIEMWLNTRDSSGYNGGVFSHWTDANNHHEIYLSDNVIYWQCLSGGSHVFTGLAASTVVTPENGWAHYAFVRNSTTFTIYKNGVAGDSTTDSDSLPALTAALEVGRIESGSQYYTGYIDSYRISDSARYTADFTAPTSAFVNDGNTKLLIQSGTDGSNTFDDLSTPDHTITANGDVRWFAPKVGAGAMAFDGTGDYFSVPASSDWDITASNSESFTLESWVKLDLHDDQETFLSAATSGSSLWRFRNRHGYGLSFQLYEGGVLEIDVLGGEIADTDWHHVALVKVGNTSDSTYTIYKDGVSVATATDSDTFTQNVTLEIGAAGGGDVLDGYMDMIRISRVARYTGTFDVPTTAFTDDINTALLLNADLNQGTWAEDQSTGLAISTDSRMKFDGTGDYLTVPDSSDWAFGTDNFTVEFWMNHQSVATGNVGITFSPTADHRQIFGYVDAGDGLFKIYLTSNGSSWDIASGVSMGTATLGAWTHYAVVRSGTTFYTFRDGVQISTFTDSASMYDSSDALSIGRYAGGNELNGYMDEIRISNTARYTSGFTPQTRGNPFTVDANTKLLIHSDYTGGLGADSSGNYNNFAATNLVATDQMVDTPTNNFCTMNPLTKRVSTLSEGNLKHTTSHSSAVATFGVTTGKWYWEQTWSGGKNEATIGFALDGADIFDTSKTTGSSVQGTNYVTLYVYDGKIYNEGSAGSALDTFAGDDILGWAVDADAGDVYLYRNGTALNSGSAVVSGKTGRTWFPMGQFTTGDVTQINYNFGADSSFAAKFTSGSAAAEDSNGKGDFYYTPKSSYLSLCTDNLSAPEIALPGDNFNTVLWTGDGAASRSITGTGFQADMMWSKIRTSAHQHNLVDRVRGVDERLLMPNLNNAEDFGTPTHGWFDSLDSDGFTITGAGGDWNVNTDTYLYVGWNWKAGGAPTADNSAGAGATPTAGSVKIDGSNLGSALAGTLAATRISANTTAGFSTVKYAGNNTSGATVAHGLSETPELIIIKNTEAAVDWIVYSEPVGNTSGLQLNGDGDAYDYLAYFNDTSPTASVFSLGNYSGVNANTEDIIAYCFHSVEGYSKVGSYTANNSATDNTFVYTGFKPAWLMVKTIDAAGQLWTIWDNARNTYNTANKVLHPDDARAEETTSQDMDFYSNGFKPYNNSGPGGGGSTWTYLYLAFAESPFKTSNAR